MSRRNSTPVIDVDLKQWHPTMMDPKGFTFITGLRGSGKSKMLEDILHKTHSWYYVMVGIARTLDSQHLLSKYTPFSLVHESADEETVDKICSAAKDVTQLIREEAAVEGTSEKDTPNRITLLACDDIFKDRKTANNPAMGDIVMNGRHYDISLVVLAQVARDLDKRFRQNVTTAIFCREEAYEGQEALFDMFFKGMFRGNFNLFRDFFLKVTEDNHVLVFQKGRGKMSNMKRKTAFDSLYRYKAEIDMPSIRIGHPSIWHLHYKHMRNRKTIMEAKRIEMEERAKQFTGTAGTGGEKESSREGRRKRRQALVNGGMTAEEYFTKRGKQNPEVRLNMVSRTPSVGAIFRKRNRGRG